MFDKIKDIVSDITGGDELGPLNLDGMERYLDGVSWPIQQDDLAAALRNNGAPDSLVDKIAIMDLGQVDSPADLFGAVQSNPGGTAGTTELQGQVDAATQDIRGDLGAASDNVKKKFGG